MRNFETVLHDWRQGKFGSNKEAYHALYKAVDETDHCIARRYDNLSGSMYLITVAALLNEGHITDEDIRDLSKEAKEDINRWIGFRNADKG